jgi:hypothetical protein
MRDAGFTYESDFLNSNKFTKLFMDFNFTGEVPSDTKLGRYGFESGITSLQSTTSYQNIPLTYNEFTTDMGWNNTTHKFVGVNSGVNYQIDYYIMFKALANNTLDFRIVKKDSGGTIINTLYSTSVSSTTGNVTVAQSYIYFSLNVNETLEFQFKSSSSAGFELFQNAGQGSTFNVTIGITLVVNSTLLNTQRGELSQWDFVKGIFNMFNLITIADKDNANNLIIEPYADVFIVNTAGTNLASRSIQYDWTEKVDATQIKLTPIELKKKTTFKYEEDDEDYPFTLYKNGTGGTLYGSKVFNAINLFGFTLLSEEEEIIASPFAATLVKPLYDRFPDFIVPAIYSSNDDQTEFEGFDNAPRILYDNGKVDSNTTYYIPEQNGLLSEQQAYFGQFTHLSEVNPTTSTTEDYNFESLQLINPVGIPFTPVNNLYNTYYAPYYNELYNADTRIMTLKVNLNAADINRFNFNDKVMIQNREYRVNKIDYKPSDLSTVEFILIG